MFTFGQFLAEQPGAVPTGDPVMIVFVTGATGALAAPTVALLRREDHTVRALARNSDSAQSLLATGSTPVPGSLLDRDALRAAVDGADAVLHLANRIAPPSSARRRAAWWTTTASAPTAPATWATPPSRQASRQWSTELRTRVRRRRRAVDRGGCACRAHGGCGRRSADRRRSRLGVVELWCRGDLSQHLGYPRRLDRDPSPASRALTIASARSATCSLLKMLDTRLRIVLGLRTSRAAIVALL